MSLCIGLTGGIASGKSFVADRFRDLGVPVLDADEVARKVTERETPGLRKIEEAFGSRVLTDDGHLDRAIMRALIFEQPDARSRLEAIIHPLVQKRMLDWRRKLEPDGGYGIYMAPLLVESGMSTKVDRLLVVDLPESVQIERVSRRVGLDDTMIRRIIGAQANRATRLAQADDILDNTHGDDTILPQIRRLHELYRQLAAEAMHG